MPWCFHAWRPDPTATGVLDATLHDVQPTRAWLDRQGRRVDPVLREYLESCLHAPFSFYEVLEVEPERRLVLRDCLTHEHRCVQEHSATRYPTPGALLYAQLASAQGIGLLEASPVFGLRPSKRSESSSCAGR
jgi:hypothetical protein